MSKTTYLFGLAKHISNRRISKLAFVDKESRISKTASVYYKAKVYKSNIGDYTYIGPRTQLVRTSIGKFCSVSYDCSLGLGSHTVKNISTSPIFTFKKNSTRYRWVDSSSYHEMKGVLIGNDVWIGTKVIIMDGVNIGNGAVIGAGSIVTKDVPDYSIVAGVPARIINYRFDKPIIERLLRLCWWEFPPELLKKNIDLFSKENITIEDLESFKYDYRSK